MEPFHIVSTKICMEYNAVSRLGYGLNKLGFESRRETDFLHSKSQTSPGATQPPGFFPEGKSGRVVKLITYLNLVPRLRMSGVIPVYPLHAFKVCKEITSTLPRPASWSSGQSFRLLITRSRVRFPSLPWGFSLWGEDPRDDHGLGS